MPQIEYSTDYNRLIYRRQYILAPNEIKECPFLNKTYKLLQNYILYAHLDLNVTEILRNGRQLIILGDIFDYTPDHKTNTDIINELIDLDFQDLIARSYRYSGRYIIIYLEGSIFRILIDNIASRKVYYANVNHVTWFSSHPQLLAEVLQLRETSDISKGRYYNSTDFIKKGGANVGDTTMYDEVFQVLPNFYFDGNLRRTFRYFPDGPLEKISIEETTKKCAEIIRGYLENIASRYELMMPITAGKDSRLLLASTRNITHRVFYYLNKMPRFNGKPNRDLTVPQRLLPKVGLKFNLVDIDKPIDSEFEKIFFRNNKKAIRTYLPAIYNYFVNFRERVNLPGNIAFDPFYILVYPVKNITPVALAEINNVVRYEFAIKYYESWLKEGVEVCRKSNLNLLTLFYWEERMANWGTQIQLDKDMAQEEFNPFNSKLLTILFLSLNYKLLSPPFYKFHKKVIRLLWPEVLREPINPGIRDRIYYFLELLGVRVILKRIKLRINKNSQKREPS